MCAGTNITIEVSGTSAIVSTTNVATVNDVTAVSGYLQNEIDNIPEQVQSNWAETDTTDPSYIQNKPDNYDLVAGDNIGISVSGTNLIISASGTDLSDYATINDVSAVSGYLQNEIDNLPEQVQSNWTETDITDPSYIQNKPNNYNLIAGDNIGISVSGTNIIISASGTDLSDYATHSEVSAVSGNLVELVNQVSASVPAAQVNADWTAVSGKAEILNKPQEHELIAGAGVSIAASGDNYVISAVVTGSPVLTGYVTEVELETVSGNIVNLIPDVSNFATNEDLQIVSAAIPDISGLATKQEVSSASGTLDSKIDTVSAAIPDISNLATKNEVQAVANDVQVVSAAIPDVSSYATRTEVNTVSGVLEGQIQTVSAAIPDVSNFATETQVIAVSGTLQTEVMAISGIVSTLPTAVPGIVAGSGIDVTASGNDYIISCTVTGGGESYNAGDYIGITDNTISVTGITDLVAGNAITITASGNSAIISSTGEAQVQSDWNVTDSSSKAYIKNKPTIPAAQVQSNWNETNTSSKAYIQNKPTIHTYTGASGISISSDVVTLDNPIGLVAVSGIEISVSGTSAIISASGIMNILGDVEIALSNL